MLEVRDPVVLSDEVLAAWTALVSAGRGLPVEALPMLEAIQSGRAVRDAPAAWIDRELRLIEAAERIKAWADFQAVAALRRLYDAVLEQCDSLYDSSGCLNADIPSRQDMRVEALTATVDEVAVATGRPEWQVDRQLQLALDESVRSASLLSALARGEVSLDRATRIHHATAGCTADDAAVIAGRLLGPMRDGSTRSHRQFVRALSDQVARHTPDQDKRHRDALEQRSVFGELHDDGTGTLTATGDAPRVAAAVERVEDISRRLRAAGDCRTLSQLRSDVLIDLVLYGWVDVVALQAGALSATAGAGSGTARSIVSPAGPTDRSVVQADGLVPVVCGPGPTRLDGGGTTPGRADMTTGRPDSDREPAAPGTDEVGGRAGPRGIQRGPHGSEEVSAQVSAELSTAVSGQETTKEVAVDTEVMQRLIATFVGAPPPAHVTVVVSLSTLLGLDDAPAEIPGRGHLHATAARQAALAHGSIWRRLVCDPLTGAALDLSTRRYRPTSAMADLVAALDGACRAPGCTVPAHRCDLDHTRPWPSGPTAVPNLASVHRRHHNHKTRGTWHAEVAADGAIVWRTMSGRTYFTDRRDWLDPHDQPATDAEVQTAHEQFRDDPPPF